MKQRLRSMRRFALCAVVSLPILIGFQNCGGSLKLESEVIGESQSASKAVSPTEDAPDGIVPFEVFPSRQVLLPKISETYVDSVPDTLDLADRARLYLQGATQSLLPDQHYIPAGPAIFHGPLNTGEEAQYIVKENGQFVLKKRPLCWGQFPCLENQQPQNWGKVALSMFLARRMSNYDADDKDHTLSAQWISSRNMIDESVNFNLAQTLGFHALQFLKKGEQNPITPTTIILEALSEMHQLGLQNAGIKSAINELVHRHHEHLLSTIQNGKSYHFYWHQPDQHNLGEQGSIRYAQAFIQGRALYALSRWRNASKDATAGKISDLLREYVLGVDNSELWRSPDLTRFPSEKGQFVGQIHSYVGAVNGLLENIKPLKTTHPHAFAGYTAFAQDVYDFVKRRTRTGPVGHFGEVGTVGDMIRLGLLLTELGVSDNWEDVDAWTRNALAEAQIDDQVAHHIPNYSTSSHYAWVNVGSKSKGLFLSDTTHVFDLPTNKNFRYNPDGPANAMRAMHEVWKNIVNVQGDFVAINLLMNRTHRFLDVKSHLPYHGRTEIVTKSKIGALRQMGVRIPPWGRAPGQVVVRRNGAILTEGSKNNGDWYWYDGGYIVIRSLQPSAVYRFDFAMPIQTQKVYTLRDHTQWWYEGAYPADGHNGDERLVEYNGFFRGNTLVDVSPRTSHGIPRFQRLNYKNFNANHETPLRTIVRSPLADE